MDGEPVGAPSRIAVSDDGTALLLWPDLLLGIHPDGDQWMTIPSAASRSWYLQPRDGHVVVISDLPPGTTVPGMVDRRRITAIEARTGQALWKRDDLIPRDFIASGLAAINQDGDLEVVETADGSTRWTRAVGPTDNLQVTTGPWLVDSNTNGGGSLLIDAATGESVTERPESSLLTAMQPIGDLWVAAWVDEQTRGGRGPRAVLVALDGRGHERWKLRLNSLLRGACCPAAIRWRDGTIAVFVPGPPTDRWLVVDAATGEPRVLPDEDSPALPGGPNVGRTHVPAQAPGRLLQEAVGELALLTADGSASMSSPGSIEVVSADPLVARQDGSIIGVQPATR